MKKTITTKAGKYSVPVTYDEPDRCPSCKYGIQPQEVNNFPFVDNDNADHFAITYLCKRCYRPFIALFTVANGTPGDGQRLEKTEFVEPNRFMPKAFDAHISAVSPAFVDIYNQALAAETSGLDQIAGVGYRKALEFLIKDYLISLNPDDVEEKAKIEKMELGNCIANKVSNEKIKAVASRSAWLGNDETHYIRKWEDKDITDLINTIDLTLHWIEAEIKTKKLLEQMPERRINNKLKLVNITLKALLFITSHPFFF